MSPAPPRPILWMENQPTLLRVRVHVVQFLSKLFLAPNIEVVKPSLPEMWFFHLRFGKFQTELAFRRAFAFFPEPPRNLLLQHLQGYRRIAPGRFAHQQMNVLWHHNESQEQEFPLGTDEVENVHKTVSRSRGSQQWPAPVTTEGYKVQVA